MHVQIVSVPRGCRSLDRLTDIMVLNLPPSRATETVSRGMEFENTPCGQTIIIVNGTDEDIQKLKEVGVVVKKIHE